MTPDTMNTLTFNRTKGKENVTAHPLMRPDRIRGVI